MNPPYYRFFEEEPGDIPAPGTGIGNGEGDPGDTPAEPSFDPDAPFLGSMTAGQALEQLNYLRDLPEGLRGLESRVAETVNPVMGRLEEIQKSIGTQPAFEPKFENLQKVMERWDDKLAAQFMPALLEDLKASFAVTPLGTEALQPHLNPLFEQQQQAIMESLVPLLLNQLPFDANGIVNRDPASNQILDPKTDLQKDFYRWWEQADAPTRNALQNYDTGYVQALHQFGKWRAEQMKGREQAAGAASARLTGSRQTSSGSQPETDDGELKTEAEGFYSVFER